MFQNIQGSTQILFQKAPNYCCRWETFSCPWPSCTQNCVKKSEKKIHVRAGTWDTPRWKKCTFHAWDFDHLIDYIDILSIGCLNHQFLSCRARPLLQSPWGRQRFGVSDHRGLFRSICPRRAVGNSATHHKSSTTVWIQLNVGHNGVFMAMKGWTRCLKK